MKDRYNTSATNSREAILIKLAALKSMTMQQLHALWLDLNKRPAPKLASGPYLTKRLAYRIQELAYGGDSAETEARLAAHAKEIFGSGKNGRRLNSKCSINLPMAGSVLTRLYQGVEYQVVVLESGGFQYNGCRYKSLSAIAKLITGMSWSGNAFFGLKQRASGRQ